MANVRVLYVRNLMMNTTEEQIKEIFQRFKSNSVERVKKLKDYAFVHFKERDDALHAMNLMNGREIDGSIVEVTLAKPVDKNQYFRFTRGVSPSTIAANMPFGLPAGSVAPTTATFDLTSHLTAIPYITFPSTQLHTNATSIPTITTPINNGATILSTGANALQQKNIRRCVNSTGRLSANGSASPPTINRSVPSTPTGILTTSSRPSQPPPTVVHHRGAYYTILRPTSRLTDIPFGPTTFGFHPGGPLFQSATLLPHPLLAAHPNGNPSFAQQPFIFTTANNPGQAQPYFHGHPQTNYPFPVFFSPPLSTIPTLTSTPTSPDSPLFAYGTPTSTTTTVTTAAGTTYSA
ncbi:unnamed protein product [Rotaria socialis]